MTTRADPSARQPATDSVPAAKSGGQDAKAPTKPRASLRDRVMRQPKGSNGKATGNGQSAVPGTAGGAPSATKPAGVAAPTRGTGRPQAGAPDSGGSVRGSAGSNGASAPDGPTSAPQRPVAATPAAPTEAPAAKEPPTKAPQAKSAPRKGRARRPAAAPKPTGVKAAPGSAPTEAPAAKAPPTKAPQAKSAPRKGRAPRPQPRAAAAPGPDPQPRPQGNPRAQAPAPKGHQPRHANLFVTRFDLWSVMKNAFMFSLAIAIVVIVAVITLWTMLSVSGVLDAVTRQVGDLVGTGTDSVATRDLFPFNTVVGVTAILMLLEVALVTAFLTLFAYLYNLSVGVTGGVQVTLTDDS